MGKARIAARIVIAIAIAGVVIWRLPINGWGSLLWVATAVAMVAIRQPYEAIISENEIAESRRTTLEIVLLAAMGLGTMALPLVHLMFGLLSFATYNLPVWAPLVGAVVLAWGLYLFRMTHSDLGRNWSVMLELREGHDLTTTGIYSRIRHPMYSAIFLICASQPFFVQNWIAGPAGLIAFTLMYVLRVNQEEAMMRDRFGDAYEAYCARTGRLWPRIGGADGQPASDESLKRSHRVEIRMTATAGAGRDPHSVAPAM